MWLMHKLRPNEYQRWTLCNMLVTAGPGAFTHSEILLATVLLCSMFPHDKLNYCWSDSTLPPAPSCDLLSLIKLPFRNISFRYVFGFIQQYFISLCICLLFYFIFLLCWVWTYGWLAKLYWSMVRVKFTWFIFNITIICGIELYLQQHNIMNSNFWSN